MRKLTQQEFISKANKIHNYFYDYSKIKYVNNSTKICIICPEHGEFWQIPSTHLSNHGCNTCSKLIKTKKLKDFLQNCYNVHGNKYNYSKVKYINTRTQIIIICPDHGEFLQTPAAHLQSQGCSKCNQSNGEKQIEQFLKKHFIKYENQKTFKNCKNKRLLPFDFYLPEHNLCIEYDGKQHFEPVRFNGISLQKSIDFFEITKHHDKIKNNFCKSNNILLIRISYWDIKNIEKILYKFII